MPRWTPCATRPRRSPPPTIAADEQFPNTCQRRVERQSSWNGIRRQTKRATPTRTPTSTMLTDARPRPRSRLRAPRGRQAALDLNGSEGSRDSGAHVPGPPRHAREPFIERRVTGGPEHVGGGSVIAQRDTHFVT